jgi:hypothetical protein
MRDGRKRTMEEDNETRVSYFVCRDFLYHANLSWVFVTLLNWRAVSMCREEGLDKIGQKGTTFI